jgi:SAM-dependent methyltransferase
MLLGVEIDQDRLALAAKKSALSQAPELTLVHADFLEFECSDQFDWVIFAFNVLAEFPTVAERIAAIRRAAAMLGTDGRILVVTPMHDFADFARSEVTHDFRVPADGGEWEAVVRCTRTRVDQITSCEITYRDPQTGHVVRDAWRSALTTRNELLAIFAAAGVELVDEYGDYALQPLSEDSTTLVHILARAK